jgi:hypothetical protein
MKKIFLLIALILFPAISSACLVEEEWFNKTRKEFDKLDVNKDGKMEKEEFTAQKNKKAQILENEWTAENAAKKGYLTKDEFVSRLRPRCIEVRK